MAYSELPWRPFLGHQAWSWTTLRRGNVFLLRLQTFFLIFVTFFAFVIIFIWTFFHIYGPNSRDTFPNRVRSSLCEVAALIRLEVCIGMGKTGIPWDSHGNGSKISHRMGMGWEWELSAWEWELRRGSCHQQLWIVFCSYIVTWSKGSNAGGATAWNWASCAELK